MLSIAGLILGGCAVLACKGNATPSTMAGLRISTALYFAVILAAAVICSSVAARRSALELLQTKE